MTTLNLIFVFPDKWPTSADGFIMPLYTNMMWLHDESHDQAGLYRTIVVRRNICGLLESVPDFIAVIIDIILALFLHDSVCSNETASSRLQMIQ